MFIIYEKNQFFSGLYVDYIKNNITILSETFFFQTDQEIKKIYLEECISLCEYNKIYSYT